MNIQTAKSSFVLKSISSRHVCEQVFSDRASLPPRPLVGMYHEHHVASRRHLCINQSCIRRLARLRDFRDVRLVESNLAVS